MPRKRVPEAERREVFTVRLPAWKIKKLEEIGNKTEIVERLIDEFLKKNK